MAGMGFAICVGLIVYAYCKDKIEHLERKIKKLERKVNGESAMSKLMEELVGKECTIYSDEAYDLFGDSKKQVVVLDVDDEWVKISYTDKKKGQMTKLMRIEDIASVELV